MVKRASLLMPSALSDPGERSQEKGGGASECTCLNNRLMIQIYQADIIYRRMVPDGCNELRRNIKVRKLMFKVEVKEIHFEKVKRHCWCTLRPPGSNPARQGKEKEKIKLRED